MVTDETIDQALARLDRCGRKTPLEGKWQTAPYDNVSFCDEQAAVILVDSVYVVGVGRVSGRLVLIGDAIRDDEQFVNSSVEAFADCAETFWDGTRDRPDNDDEALEAAAQELRKKMELLDPHAFEGENQLWPTAIEEFGYGI